MTWFKADNGEDVSESGEIVPIEQETSEEKAEVLEEAATTAKTHQRIRYKETGSYALVGWRTAMALVRAGRAEYVE
jgi:hypothetical protein